MGFIFTNNPSSVPVGAGTAKPQSPAFDPNVMKQWRNAAYQQDAPVMQGSAPYSSMNASSPSMVSMLLPLAGSLVAGAVTISYLTGADFISGMTAFNGALGATAGLAVSPYVAPMMPVSLRMVTPVALAIAVPAAVGAQLDSTVVMIGLASSAGAYVTSRYL